MASSFELDEVLAGETLGVEFQPILSVRKKVVVGYEGLIRGIHPKEGSLIPPVDLFHEAYRSHKTLELDRLCRRKVMEGFLGESKTAPRDRFLSLNFESSVLDQGVVGSRKLIDQVTAIGLDPQQVALEIIESKVQETADLKKFIQAHRSYGFLIALDDVGAGHSNLNRIALLKPDILKIDRYLVHGIQEDFHKQQVFRALITLAHKTGSLILAEGIETQEEALYLMEAGVDLVQGYHFARPAPLIGQDESGPRERMEFVSARYKEKILQDHNVKRFNLRKYELMTREIQMELSKNPAHLFDQVLSQMVHYFPLVECLYVIDEKGIQVTETVFGTLEEKPKNRLLFQPSPVGTDHTMKDYFFMLVDGGLKKATFISEPYLSMVTGRTSMTFARIFKNAEEGMFILCVDIDTQYLKQISLG
ncbi:MAG TPA: EAL domain-containing protein [bacterium]|nr:EAL domain-containing protein [bacterium]